MWLVHLTRPLARRNESTSSALPRIQAFELSCRAAFFLLISCYPHQIYKVNKNINSRTHTVSELPWKSNQKFGHRKIAEIMRIEVAQQPNLRSCRYFRQALTAITSSTSCWDVCSTRWLENGYHLWQKLETRTNFLCNDCMATLHRTTVFRIWRLQFVPQ